MKKNLLESALNLFFPPTCGFCNEISNSYICKYCLDYLEKVQINKADIYDDKFFTTHVWLFKYENEIREKIIDYKFNNKPYLYRSFAELITMNQDICHYINSFDIIIPVPIHKKRKKFRGYNQSELIAKEITKNIKTIQLQTDLIEKIKNITPQSMLNKDERIENVINAYKANENIDISGKNILLLDDVYTTGSTVNECAKVLKRSNCGKIGVLTLAKD